MKRILVYSILASIILLASCRKSDNPKLPTLERVPVPLLTKGTTGDQSVSAVTPAASAAFSANFLVDLKFPTDTKPAKMDVVVRKNSNNSNVKIYQATVTAWPTTVNISGATLISMFGAVVLGDKFDFGVDIYTQDGQKFEAFPVTGAAYGSGIPSEYGGVTTVISYSAICPYDASIFPTGAYTVLQDDWADYTVGQVATLTQIDATHISFKYLANNALPIIITINPANNSTSAAKQQYGDYGPPYGNWFAQSVAGSADNFVAPCDKIISIRLTHTSSNNYTGGDNTIKFRKN